MSKINVNFYTKGKFGKSYRETIDTDNEYLYSKGYYPTKIKKEDLPKDYIFNGVRPIYSAVQRVLSNIIPKILINIYNEEK